MCYIHKNIITIDLTWYKHCCMSNLCLKWFRIPLVQQNKSNSCRKKHKNEFLPNSSCRRNERALSVDVGFDIWSCHEFRKVSEKYWYLTPFFCDTGFLFLNPNISVLIHTKMDCQDSCGGSRWVQTFELNWADGCESGLIIQSHNAWPL